MKVSEVLATLATISPGAILAGGWLRDQQLGAPAKDLDFFVPYGLTCEALKGLFPEAKPEVYSAFLEYSTGEVEDVFNIGTFEGYPAQVIVLKEGLSPMGRVHHMDFGFCQIACGMGTSLLTEAFEKDARDNTATLVYCEDEQEFARSMRRWARLKLKYPTRRLVIPSEFMQWSR